MAPFDHAPSTAPIRYRSCRSYSDTGIQSAAVDGAAKIALTFTPVDGRIRAFDVVGDPDALAEMEIERSDRRANRRSVSARSAP